VGLLYDPQACAQLEDLLGRSDADLGRLLQFSVGGLDHPELRATAQKLMEIAIDGFSRMPKCFQSEGSMDRLVKFNEHFTSRGRTPADDWLDRAKNSDGILTEAQFRATEDAWNQLIS
jgi:hypothetical protein